MRAAALRRLCRGLATGLLGGRRCCSAGAGAGPRPNELGLFYDARLESLVNDQINAELRAAYVYLNMASYYGRPNVALPGLHGYFMKMFYEEIEHTVGFLNYQNLRGGVARFCPVANEENEDWNDIPATLGCAFQLESSVKQQLVKLHQVASECGDSNATDFLDTYIQTQEESLCELLRLRTRAAQLASSELGRYLLDRELHETHVRPDAPRPAAPFGGKLYA